MLSGLLRRDRELLLLVAWAGLSYEESAQALGASTYVMAVGTNRELYLGQTGTTGFNPIGGMTTADPALTVIPGTLLGSAGSLRGTPMRLAAIQADWSWSQCAVREEPVVSLPVAEEIDDAAPHLGQRLGVSTAQMTGDPLG